MPIDPNIVLQGRAPQFDNIQEIQARGMQLRQLGRQEQEAARGDQERIALRDLYRNATKPDGSIDNTVLLTGLAQIGQGEKIPAAQKGIMDARKATTDVQASELDLKLKQLGHVRGVISALLANPNPTQDDVIREISGAVSRGEIPADMGAQMARSIPGRPEQLRPFLIQKAMEGADHTKRLELMLPKYDEQDRGGTISQGTLNPLTGARTETGSVRKTMSPGESAVAARSADGGTPVGYRRRVDGGLEPIPGGPADPKTKSTKDDSRTFAKADKLRDEFNTQSKDFVQVGDSYNVVREMAKNPTAAGDLSMIFAYMKMLDPNSVVREQEFANAQNAAGIPDRVRNAYNKALNGERLNPDQRADFIAQAKSLYQTRKQRHDKLKTRYGEIATRNGVDVQDVVGDMDVILDEAAAVDAQPIPADIAALLQKHGGK